MIDGRRARRARIRLRVGDPDFQAPDGGWGWLVVFAAGFITLCVISLFQQFGLIYRKKFAELGITQTQTTTVINVGAAMYSGVGLANGPLFRRFTYRQVSLVGTIFVALSTLASIFCSSFATYIFCYSIVYGTSFGIVQSAVGLALNTYFEEKRRIATGLSWTATALGPVMWPYIIVASNEYYGINGTLLLFTGVAMHGFALSLLLQPVEWHTKFREDCTKSEKEALFDNGDNQEMITIPSQTQEMLRRSLAASYEVIGIPVMPTINDEMFFNSRCRRGSRHSLYAHGILKKQTSGDIYKPSSFVDLAKPTEALHETHFLETKLDKSISRAGDSQVQENSAFILIKPLDRAVDEDKESNPPPTESLSIWRRISLFFDFELFKDLVYVNIMVGISLASFVEINFSILTPIILKEFNFPEIDVATFMSLLGFTDIIFRFAIPFVADKIGWSNRTFFLIGVMSMAFARIILIHTQTYYVALLVAVILGAGKAFRTIFFALAIPSHVPLERLPAASGLQLAFGGFVFIVLGPLIGWIRHLVGSYVITLHLLNLCTYGTAISWIAEFIITNRRKRKAGEVE